MVIIAEALALAAQQCQAGQLADADRVLREVLQIEPDNAEALHLLGLVAIGARQFEAAIELIRRAIVVDVSRPAFHANLAEAHRLAGNFAQAITCNLMALQLDPQLAAPHCNLGWTYYQQGNLAAAEAAFRRAVEIHPQDARS